MGLVQRVGNMYRAPLGHRSSSEGVLYVQTTELLVLQYTVAMGLFKRLEEYVQYRG